MVVDRAPVDRPGYARDHRLELRLRSTEGRAKLILHRTKLLVPLFEAVSEPLSLPNDERHPGEDEDRREDDRDSRGDQFAGRMRPRARHEEEKRSDERRGGEDSEEPDAELSLLRLLLLEESLHGRVQRRCAREEREEQPSHVGPRPRRVRREFRRPVPDQVRADERGRAREQELECRRPFSARQREPRDEREEDDVEERVRNLNCTPERGDRLVVDVRGSERDPRDAGDAARDDAHVDRDGEVRVAPLSEDLQRADQRRIAREEEKVDGRRRCGRRTHEKDLSLPEDPSHRPQELNHAEENPRPPLARRVKPESDRDRRDRRNREEDRDGGLDARRRREEVDRREKRAAREVEQ
jgi:hypothetical protein